MRLPDIRPFHRQSLRRCARSPRRAGCMLDLMIMNSPSRIKPSAYPMECSCANMRRSHSRNRARATCRTWDFCDSAIATDCHLYPLTAATDILDRHKKSFTFCGSLPFPTQAHTRRIVPLGYASDTLACLPPPVIPVSAAGRRISIRPNAKGGGPRVEREGNVPKRRRLIIQREQQPEKRMAAAAQRIYCCNLCGKCPIVGVVFHCQTCKDWGE